MDFQAIQAIDLDCFLNPVYKICRVQRCGKVHIVIGAKIYATINNSLFGHFLARLRRKSKCCSKSKDMPKYSVMLLMLKWNAELDAMLN